MWHLRVCDITEVSRKDLRSSLAPVCAILTGRAVAGRSPQQVVHYPSLRDKLQAAVVTDLRLSWQHVASIVAGMDRDLISRPAQERVGVYHYQPTATVWWRAGEAIVTLLRRGALGPHVSPAA